MNQKNLEGEFLIISHFLYESAISKAQCELILAETDWSHKEDGSYMKQGKSVVNAKIRKTDVAFVPYYSPIGCILQSHITAANAYKWKYDIRSFQDIQIAHYQVDNHYDWHTDTSWSNENNMQRKLSAVIMLSDPSDYEGGLLELKNVELPKLSQGTLIVFPSIMQHRVTKVTKGNRYTAVAWAVGPAFR
tara:strand:+ start:174 stop:743 length:570 start_codon:yes stop_codon:yes gene_type:complete